MSFYLKEDELNAVISGALSLFSFHFNLANFLEELYH